VGLLAAAAAVLIVLGCAAVAAAASPSTGDSKGRALLERIRRAYGHVPAIRIVDNTSPIRSRTTIVLRSGVAVAQQTVATNRGGGKTTYVSRLGSGTFLRRPGGKCWRRQGPPINGIGRRFPDIRGSHVEAPKPSRSGWLLPVVSDVPSRAVTKVARITFDVDGKTFRIRRIVTPGTYGSIAYVTPLGKAPQLPTPSPLCSR
jgi:hypothetical protein